MWMILAYAVGVGIAVASVAVGVFVLYAVCTAIWRLHLANKQRAAHSLGGTDGKSQQGDEAEAPDAYMDGDCATCWCNSCACVDSCKACPPTVAATGFAPLPCEGCGMGMRFRPIEGPRCLLYRRCGGA